MGVEASEVRENQLVEEWPGAVFAAGLFAHSLVVVAAAARECNHPGRYRQKQLAELLPSSIAFCTRFASLLDSSA